MSASTSPSYDALKRRLEAAESALKAIREGRVDTILGERETLVVRLAGAEAREAHLKQVLLAIRNVNQLIVAEDNPRRLIEQACVNLTETMGYHNAWIALLGGEAARGLGLQTEGPVVVAAAAGFDGGFEILREHLERGEFPDCMARAMESEDVLVVGDPATDCPDCPLHGQYGGRAGLVRRLNAEGVTYGILTVSVPAAYARDNEEQDLFNEVAGDLSFALYKIAAARELKDAHRRYRDLFEKHGAVKLIIDPEDGRIVDANAAAVGFYGWNRDELCRMRISDINTLPSAQVKTEMENARTLKRTHFEFKHRRADGSVRDVAVYSSKVEADGKALLYSIVHDITDRKQAEQALQENEAYQRTILQTIADGFWVIDGKGRIVEVNRAYCQMTGYSRDEIIGLGIGDLDAVETPAETARRIERIMQAGHEIFETSHRRKDGSVFPVEVSTTYIEARGGQFVCFCRDLTERKQAEEKIRAAEETYRNVFLNAQIGMFRTDIKTGLVLDANDAVARFAGYRDRREMLAAPFRIAERYVNPGDREKMTALLKADSEVTDFETPFRRNDGSTIIMRFSARLVPEKGWIEGVSVDITRERQAEETLIRQHTMLARTEALAHMGSWEWEAEGDKVTWSEELFRIFGLDPMEEAPPFAEHQAFYVPEDRARLVKAVEKCLQNGVPYDLEVCVTRTDGQLRHCIVRGIPEHGADGSVNRLYGSLHDITEMKRAKERIAILGHMLDEAPVSITIHDNEGRFLYANQKTIALHGYDDLDAFLKINLHELDVPESEALLAERFRKIDEAGEARFDVEHYRKDGSTFPLEVLAKQIKWEDRPAVLSIAADITEQKTAEEALRESESRVRTKLNALLDPEGDIETLPLADVVDCDEIQSLMNDFHALTGIGVGILDLDGHILVKTGWQDVCTKFHRVHPETAERCQESDTALASGVEPGTFKIYKCKNNMWDMATPIIISGKKVGNLFLGQFFFDDETPDVATFREQARCYGFDEDAYLKAYRAIPRWSRKTVDQVMTFYCHLINVIARLSYAHIKLARATEALRIANTKLFMAMQAARQGLWEWNLTTDTIHFDDAALEMLGYGREDIQGPMKTGTWWMDQVYPDDKAFMTKQFNRYISGKEKDYRVEFRLKNKGGGYLWVDSSAKLISKDPDENPEIVVGIHQDISDRKMVEQELRRREELLNQAQEIAQLGSYVWSIGDDCLEWSRQMFAIAGIDPGGFYENLQETVLNLIHPDDRDGVNEQVGQMVEQKRTWPMEFRLLRPDGNVRWLRSTSRFEYDGRGEPVMCMGVHHDITEKKQSEAEHEKLQNQLAQAQKMESVGRLAGGVAHDFNNMLGIILGHADMILEEMAPDQPFYANLTEIIKAGERSADLTRQLLAFARKQTVAPRVIDLNKTVEGMLKMLHRLIGEDIDMDWVPGKTVWPVKIDPTQIDQVLANLCVNARDAIAGVGNVTIETGNMVFHEDDCKEQAGFVPGEYVMLTVSDTGCGMDTETLSHLFEPFFTTKEVDKGTGLGLATVYGVVKQNNGFINVYSEPGQGTTFRIYLPRYRAKEAPLPDKGAILPAARGHETILLVEDEPAILQMTTKMLARTGYKVLAAGTPGEAMALAREHAGEIHLLMTDVVMPEMNGRDLAKNLLSLYPNLKRLFMSGYTADVIAHHGVLNDGMQFIQKPFAKHDLAIKVREVLDENNLF